MIVSWRQIIQNVGDIIKNANETTMDEKCVLSKR